MYFVTSQGDIADTYQRAFDAISQLASGHVSHSEHTSQQAVGYRFSDELERLEIWSSEHGVQRGRLDYKLRESSVLRKRILSLLEELARSADAKTASQTSKRSHTSPEGDADQVCARLVNPPKSLTDGQIRQDSTEIQSSGGHTSSSIDTGISLPDSASDTTELLIHDNVTLLLELGPSLLDPVPHDRFSRTAHLDGAQPDLDHARAKFPKAETKLISRVGVANWERRQSLRDLRIEFEVEKKSALVSEHSRISSQLQEDDLSQENLELGEEGSEDSLSAPSVTEPMSATTNTKSLFGFSDTGPLSTLGTELSMSHFNLRREDVLVEQRYRVPPPPIPNEDFSGREFLCPYCFRCVTGIASRTQWIKHVFEDLKPYMCTYTDCALSSKTYGNKKTWWRHEAERHRAIRRWECTPCERSGRDHVFETSEAFDNHIHSLHPDITTPTQLRSIRGMCHHRVGTARPQETCPFCRETIRTTMEDARGIEHHARKHVADHLEQLTFFVAFPAGLMASQDDDSEFMDDSDSESGQKTEIDSMISDERYRSKQDVRIANVHRFMADQKASSPPVSSKGQVSSSPINRAHAGPDQPTAVAEKIFPIRILMHPPNEHFYGRDSLINDADAILLSPGQICVFHGVGGIGKTLAAVEYIYRHQDRYDAVFWLQADTTPGLSESFVQMATSLGLIHGFEDHAQAMERGRDWLQETAKRWLLVFDNTLTWEAISPYMPNHMRQTNGLVLITTQMQNVLRPSENVTKMHLETLDQESGSEMLLKYLKKDVKDDSERQLAREISTFVGGLPVAIAHVAGYADFSGYKLEELIEEFREWRRRTGAATDERDDLPLAFREKAVSYNETLAMVWSVTLRELTQDAQGVMYILAYLNCEAVPESMLWGIHEDPSLQFLDVRERIRSRRTKESLVGRRLVNFKKVDGETCISLHRSLQRGIRETLSYDPKKQQLVFGQAIALLREVFPRSNPLLHPMPEKWSEYQKLLPHLHALHDVYNKAKPNIKGSLDFAQLLSDAAIDMFERGIIKEVLLLLKTAEEVLDAVAPGEEQVMRADIHAMISTMYDNTGIENREESFERRKKALEIRRKVVEDSETPKQKDEMLLYNSEMEYAISLLHYHRYRQAEPVIEKCRRKYLEWGTEEEIPFEYAKYYNKIAMVRMYQGQFEEAIRLATHGSRLMDKTGFAVFATRFKFDVACITLQSGDVDQALRIHYEIYNSRLEKLGQTNDLTLHSCYAIGAIYEIKGQFEDAEAWYRKALEQRRAISSWPDEAFYRAQFHLATVLRLRGNPADIEIAQALRDKAVRVLHRLLPLDFPPELDGVTDESVLFDHMLTISGASARFTGQGLLKYFIKHPA